MAYDVREGDSWPSDYPPIFIGHIHEQGQFAPNVLCVGTPRHVSFREASGEQHPNKTVSLIQFVDGSWKETRIPIPLPRKFTQKIHASLVSTYVPPPGADVKLVI